MAWYHVTESVFERRNWTEPWDYPERSGALVLLDRDFPSLSSFFFNFEKEFVYAFDVVVFSRRYYWIGYFFAMLYLAFVCIAPKLMENRKAFDLRGTLKYWNLLLAVYSTVGMLRVVPHLLVVIWRYGFTASICSPPVYMYGHGTCGLWTSLFIYSKFFELIDTVFIVLRKKKLSFLHWYHHVTVLLYTWDAFVQEQPPGLYFCAMNYTVHSIMYLYYYLAAVMQKPPRWGIAVTILQIAQMFFGVAITGVCLFHSFTMPYPRKWTRQQAIDPISSNGCYLSRMNLWGACLMYSTYFYLFAEFFVQRYLSKKVKVLQADTGGIQTSPTKGSRSGQTGSTLSTPAVEDKRKKKAN